VQSTGLAIAENRASMVHGAPRPTFPLVSDDAACLAFLVAEVSDAVYMVCVGAPAAVDGVSPTALCLLDSWGGVGALPI